mmetsp:Transcript_11283/g.37110  ORF Transcript_11283/g.37110 Transcript_11283/m.37110 type:complete len:600 (-) Transcript_11283:1084-2883(-)
MMCVVSIVIYIRLLHGFAVDDTAFPGRRAPGGEVARRDERLLPRPHERARHFRAGGGVVHLRPEPVRDVGEEVWARARLELGGVHEALGGRLPAQAVLLVGAQGLGLRLEGVLDELRKLLLVAVDEAVAKGGEELVAGVLRHNDKLAHGERFGGGGGHDVGEGRVDEDFVCLERRVGVVGAAVEFEREAEVLRLAFHLREVVPVSVHVEAELRLALGVVLLHEIQELGVAFAPNHLAQKVDAFAEHGWSLLRRELRLTLRLRLRLLLLPLCAPLGEFLPDAEEARADAMDVADLGAWEILHGARELHHLVAVRAADELVDEAQRLLLGVAVFLPLDVLEVIGVDDADDVVELGGPARAVVVPVEVFRLLEHRYVRFALGNEARDVPNRENGPFVDRVASGVKRELDVRLEPDAVRNPAAHPRLLLGGLAEHRLRVHQLLVRRREPRHHQRHRTLAVVREVGGAQERVHARARHPRQRRRGDDAHCAPGVAQRLVLKEAPLLFASGAVREGRAALSALELAALLCLSLKRTNRALLLLGGYAAAAAAAAALRPRQRQRKPERRAGKVLLLEVIIHPVHFAHPTHEPAEVLLHASGVHGRS